nr:MAG TPA: hypothetical protein [Bacteriophage sp.]
MSESKKQTHPAPPKRRRGILSGLSAPWGRFLFFWLAPADYCNYNSSGVVLYVGGNYNQNRNRGPFYLNGNYAASNYNANIGSRLLVEARISALFWRRFSRTAR